MGSCPRVKKCNYGQPAVVFTLFRTLLIHGLESDWIEEEMADDDDFRLSFTFPPLHKFTSSCCTIYSSYRKDVLEQKLKKVTDDIGYKNNTKYKVCLFCILNF